MDSQSQLTVDIITKVIQGKISINNAAKRLNRSRRTVERYIAKCQKFGIKFIMLGNKGKLPVNKLCDRTKRTVQSLIKDNYHDVNLQHLSGRLVKNEHIDLKRETLRRWAHAIHHVKCSKRRRSHVWKRRERMTSAG